jgi:hypothetical protein
MPVKYEKRGGEIESHMQMFPFRLTFEAIIQSISLLALILLMERLDDILALHIHISSLVSVDSDSPAALKHEDLFDQGKNTVCKPLLSADSVKNTKLLSNRKDDFIFT